MEDESFRASSPEEESGTGLANPVGLGSAEPVPERELLDAPGFISTRTESLAILTVDPFELISDEPNSTLTLEEDPSGFISTEVKSDAILTGAIPTLEKDSSGLIFIERNPEPTMEEHPIESPSSVIQSEPKRQEAIELPSSEMQSEAKVNDDRFGLISAGKKSQPKVEEDTFDVFSSQAKPPPQSAGDDPFAATRPPQLRATCEDDPFRPSSLVKRRKPKRPKDPFDTSPSRSKPRPQSTRDDPNAVVHATRSRATRADGSSGALRQARRRKSRTEEGLLDDFSQPSEFRAQFPEDDLCAAGRPGQSRSASEEDPGNDEI
jgi:hypothetical protein